MSSPFYQNQAIRDDLKINKHFSVVGVDSNADREAQTWKRFFRFYYESK